ncbi:hypothetical protein BGX30_006445, partial [Mortierella sp. GBA39]
MNTNINNDCSTPASSSLTPSKGKKSLADITNTVSSSSPLRGLASPAVAGSPRPSAPLPVPLSMVQQVLLVSKDGPHDAAFVEPFHIDAYWSDVWQQWRRALKVLNDLEPQLANQYLAPKVHSHYYWYYEQARDRERTLFTELSRLTVPPPGPPLEADPNLVAIHTVWGATDAAHQAAW